MDNIRYSIKAKIYRKLIAESFLAGPIDHIFDIKSKRWYVIIEFPYYSPHLKRCIKIEPDLKWSVLKETIHNIFFNSDFYTNDICSIYNGEINGYLLNKNCDKNLYHIDDCTSWQTFYISKEEYDLSDDEFPAYAETPRFC